MHERTVIRFVRDADAAEAAGVARAIFGETPGKRLREDRTSISRAMHGSECNPLRRLRRWIRRAHEVGVPVERVHLILADLRAAILDAYGEASDYREACRAMRRAAAEADGLQLDAMADPDVIPIWIARAKRHAAALDVAIAAAEREAREVAATEYARAA
ncbi:MAG TPA: hypothetical protein VK039_07910 [Brevibacterium sp.]|nr:hypothetical protein [Brevibacterium sp.]